MGILITGGAGMLGRTLVRRLDGRSPLALGSRDLDVGDAQACDEMIRRQRPAVVVHCAAMTAVDRCESERDAAFRVNALGSANIAAACARHGARLVAISTDYVFPGTLERPYHEWDETGPRSVYGQSKLAGEQAIRDHCGDHLIARVAWLYGPGGASFLHTMLKLGAATGPPLTVVEDQIGNPTSTDAVADALLPLLESALVGTVHLSCEGEVSWYGFTQAIFAQTGLPRAVTPCSSAAYPRPAPRPLNSRLEKRFLRLHRRPPMADWRTALTRFLKEFPHG
jgi:dTDP-4-dehydrorhamnose reductase